MTEEHLDKMGRLIDRIENLVHATRIPMPDKLRETALSALRVALTNVHSEFKTLYVEIAGDDPWAEGA